MTVPSCGFPERNWKGYCSEIRLPAGALDWQRALITDPQTSGGLLIACSANTEAEVMAEFRRHGSDSARRIGQMVAGQGVAVE